MPLPVWFRAIWWVVTQKNGASALGLQRILGLSHYKTAWMLLHKIRCAMVAPERSRLSGKIEVDETFIGGLEEGVAGRQTDKKALVVIAAQEGGKHKKVGRIRMKHISDAGGKTLREFITGAIEPGSVVRSDGWRYYNKETLSGYGHEVRMIKGSGKSAHELLPRVHLVSSLLKRWLLGTHQGAVSAEHLQSYLDEFVFRFNRRSSRHRGLLFLRVLENAVKITPTPYKKIIKEIRHRPEHPSRR